MLDLAFLRQNRDLVARAAAQKNVAIDLDAILDKGAFDLKRILEFEPDFLEHGHDHEHGERWRVTVDHGRAGHGRRREPIGPWAPYLRILRTGCLRPSLRHAATSPPPRQRV